MENVLIRLSGERYGIDRLYVFAYNGNIIRITRSAAHDKDEDRKFIESKVLEAKQLSDLLSLNEK
jgi:hypothetical protein